MTSPQKPNKGKQPSSLLINKGKNPTFSHHKGKKPPRVFVESEKERAMKRSMANTFLNDRKTKDLYPDAPFNLDMPDTKKHVMLPGARAKAMDDEQYDRKMLDKVEGKKRRHSRRIETPDLRSDLGSPDMGSPDTGKRVVHLTELLNPVDDER